MSRRETVIEYVSKLPDDRSLADIAREVELLAGIHTALQQVKLGSGILAEDTRKSVDAWAAR